MTRCRHSAIRRTQRAQRKLRHSLEAFGHTVAQGSQSIRAFAEALTTEPPKGPTA